jgi:glycosyltransferase involved in cell wall biosynthesis
VAAGADVTLVVPREWPDDGAQASLSPERFRVVELDVHRAGDVNRHVYRDGRAVRRLIDETQPDVVDIHEEPYSNVARQWLGASRGDLPFVMYAAQNIDKRFPPPFFSYERTALRRVTAFYPCSRQAGSVLRGKGFAGSIKVLPLGYDDAVFRLGAQSLGADEIVLMLVGRLIPEKGVEDAVRTLARAHAVRPSRLVVSGRGPDEFPARRLAESLGVADRVEFRGWQSALNLASDYRAAHLLLVPSRPTTVAEQFGRVIVEAQASGAVVAGYACGAIPEVAGEAAAIVPLGDVEQLAERVSRLILDPEDFARRREAGQRQAGTRTWQAIAAEQMSLYSHACQGLGPTVDLPKSPRRRRQIASAEFGPTAWTAAGVRPFALPLLRRGGVVSRALGTVIDATTELAARFMPGAGRTL